MVPFHMEFLIEAALPKTTEDLVEPISVDLAMIEKTGSSTKLE